MLLGIDMGSGGVKLTALYEDGRMAAEAIAECPTLYPQPSFSEQSPDDWQRCLGEALAKLGQQIPLGGIRAVAPDAATHTCVLLDENYRPLDNAIFWTDQRSGGQAARLMAEHGEEILAKCLHPAGTIWTLCQLLWVMENKPEIFSKIRHLLFEKDYIRYLLTGRPATDTIEASGSMLYSHLTGGWDDSLCAMCGLDPSVLPELIAPTDIAGTVTPEAAQWTRLKAGTPVLCGTTDTVMEVFGAGAIRPGQATVKLATAGRICVVTDRAVPDANLINYPHVAPGMWYPGIATRSAASAFRWYRDALGRDKYPALDEEAAKIPAGSEGLFFHPYLMGELAPYNDGELRASFVGATMRHTRAHFTRAALEGIAFSLRDAFDVLTAKGLSVREAAMIGGGSRSALWQRITADVLGLRLRVPQNSDSSFASAMLAGIGIGVFASLDDALGRCASFVAEIEPDPETHAFYEERFRIYRAVHDALAPVYRMK